MASTGLDLFGNSTGNATIRNSSSGLEDCPYHYSDISLLENTEITAAVALAWPCELREYWISLQPLVHLVESLLNYGTIGIISLGLIFNLLIIYTLSRGRMRTNTSHMYLLALAVYDSCVLVFNFMVGVLRGQNPDTINKAFQENEWLCLLHSVVVELFNLLSVWMIVCFTIERVIAVTFPLKVAQLCSMRRTRLIIILVSIAILIVSLHKLFVSGFEGDSVFGYKACHTNRKKFREAIYAYVAINTWMPALVIMVLNCVIISRVNKSARIHRQMSLVDSRYVRAKSTTRQMRITRMLLVTSITFLALLLPLGITQTTELLVMSINSASSSVIPSEQEAYIKFSKQTILLKYIRAFCFFFYQLNFCINIFVYIFTNKKFRHVFIGNFPGLFPDWVQTRYGQSPSLSSLTKNTCIPIGSSADLSRSRTSVKCSTTVEMIDNVEQVSANSSKQEAITSDVAP